MSNNEFAQSSFLVVDDDEFSGDVIEGALNRIEVGPIHRASNGEEALRMAKLHRPDFVLLDIYMPEMDGWAILDALRKSLPSVVVLMITGSIRQQDFKKSLASRVDGYCIKPVSFSILRNSLEQAVISRRGSAR